MDQLLLLKALQNTWKYFKVIWKSQGSQVILFCLTCGNLGNTCAHQITLDLDLDLSTRVQAGAFVSASCYHFTVPVL